MSALLFTLIPWAALSVGAVATSWRRPGPATTSAVQHFAAGLVFAAAAGEILPSLKHQGAAVPVLLGGALGVALMLTVKQLSQRAKGASSMVAIIGVDLLIDGLVLAIAFAAGARQGGLLTVALTIEVLFLGLTVANALGEGPPFRRIATTIAVGALLPMGALVGIPIAALPGSILTGFYAFGLVALLYLVTEELLVEAHEQLETPWITATFFAGFLFLLLLEEAV